MLFIKIYGVEEQPIGHDEFFVKCPACEAQNWADVLVVSKYYHFYFIPMWPIAKEANIICQKCGLKRYGLNFDSAVIDNFEEIKSKFRHPWFSWIGFSVIGLIALAAIAQIFF